MNEREREKSLSSEENDLLHRSNKKFKHSITDPPNVRSQQVQSPTSGDSDLASFVQDSLGSRENPTQGRSYSQAARGFGSVANPLYDHPQLEDEDISDDDILLDCDSDDES